MKCKNCDKDFLESKIHVSTITGLCRKCAFNKMPDLDHAKNNRLKERQSQQKIARANLLNARREIFPEKKPLLKRTLTQEMISGNRLQRTNSVYFDEKDQDLKMKPSHRNYQSGKKYERDDKKEWQDQLIINVFSLEASKNFAIKYHNKLSADKTFNMEVNSQINESVQEELAKNVGYFIETSFVNGIKSLLKDKQPPHVIPVIEGGKRDQSTKKCNFDDKFTFTDIQGKKHDYFLSNKYLNGKTKKGTFDVKQNMNFYIRTDMKNAISIEEINVNAGSITDIFPAAEIQFDTDDDAKYSIVIVHIPNEYAGSKSQKTHDAIKKYCEDRTDRIVVGYIGDTNFTHEMESFSIPSYGGNQGEFFMSPTSSSAQKHTYFMQAIAVNDKKMSFAMGQPTALNSVYLNISDMKENTDHPSIQTVVLLDSKIKNRIYD